MAALLPLLGGRFEAAGFDGLTIGGLMATFPLGRLVAAPLWAVLADRYRVAGLVLRLSAVLSGAAGMALARAESIPVLAGAIFIFAATRAPIGAVFDALVLGRLSELGRPTAEYGRIRLWGSLGFLGGVVLASNWAATGLPPHLLVDGTLLAAAGVSFGFPLRGACGPAPILPALRELAASPFLLPLLVTGALQALTMSVYDTFYSVHVAALGLPVGVVGASMALGVGCEVLLMVVGRPLLRRLGPSRGLLLAALSGLPRWLVTATATDPAVLVATQSLHGFGFALFWLSGVQRMSQAARPEIAASSQSLWAAATYGFGALAGAGLAGLARREFGSDGIFWMLAFVSLLASMSAVWLWRVDRPKG